MKKTLLLVIVLVIGLVLVSADVKETMKKAGELMKAEKYGEAYELIDAAIAEEGESGRLLSWKYYLLFELERYEEALETALKKEEIAEKKSPWNCIDIVMALTKLDKKEEAMSWLHKAVNRGFIGYYMLEAEPDFESLRGTKEFSELVSAIKDSIGIGKPVTDFSVALLSGETFTLSEQKDKVVLIDFWAVWCGPCRAEMPNLKEYYMEFKEKGFEIIGISLDEDKDSLDDYIAKENLEWKISFSGKGWDDKTASLYGVNSIPSYWLVDKEGNLKHFGLRGESLKKAIMEMIEE